MAFEKWGEEDSINTAPSRYIVSAMGSAEYHNLAILILRGGVCLACPRQTVVLPRPTMSDYMVLLVSSFGEISDESAWSPVGNHYVPEIGTAGRRETIAPRSIQFFLSDSDNSCTLCHNTKYRESQGLHQHCHFTPHLHLLYG